MIGVSSKSHSIVRQSGVVPDGTDSDRIISQYDIFPTLLELVGLHHRVIENSPAKIFVSTLRVQEQVWAHTAFYEYITVRAIVKQDWKYVRRMFGEPSEEKYDPWKGGAGKATLMYSNKNERFQAQFPNWRKPAVEAQVPFSDLDP